MEIKDAPTVILEAGAGDFSFDWSLVQPKVATFARVYSYDRAGSAWSDLGPKPHTMQQAVYELHTLLHKATVPGPYVLVGASYGGFLVRLFAQQYPKEVAGIVLVDAGNENGELFINGKMLRPSTDATGQPIPPVKTVATKEDNDLARTPEARKVIGDALSKAGLPCTQLDAPYRKLPDSIQQIRLWAISQMEYYAANDNNYIIDERASMVKDREKQPQMFDNMPLIVLTAGNTSKPDNDSEERERMHNQAGLTTLSKNSKQIIAEKSGHHIQLDDPDLVTEAIREVVESVRKNKPLVSDRGER